MEELGVALIEAILSRQPPVAGANCDSAGARVRLLQELTGDVVLDRPSLAVAQEQPDQADALLDGVRLDVDLAG